jgi:hypothetical protein
MKNTRSNNRIGRFSMATPLLHDWEGIQDLMKQFVVIQASRNYVKDTIDYTAFSTLFKEVSLGVKPPQYDIVCKQLKDGGVKYGVVESKVQ